MCLFVCVCLPTQQVLALQALQPLLLVSADLSTQHNSSIAALLTAADTPAALLLQAVISAGGLISARPAESSVLVSHLETLLLNALAAVSGNDADGCNTAPCHRRSTSASSTGAAARQHEGSGVSVPTAAAAVVAAARWYCHLLLSEKLLLTGYSWGVVAAGLLATGPLQVCCLTPGSSWPSFVTLSHAITVNCNTTQVVNIFV